MLLAPPSLPRSLDLSHLAAATAEPIAAHGVVSQGAFLAAVATRPAALLRVAGRSGKESKPLSSILPIRSSPLPPRPSSLLPRARAHTGDHPDSSLTCTEPQSHSSPASTKPFPHSGGSRSWRGRECREPGWDPARPPILPSPASRFSTLVP